MVNARGPSGWRPCHSARRDHRRHASGEAFRMACATSYTRPGALRVGLTTSSRFRHRGRRLGHRPDSGRVGARRCFEEKTSAEATKRSVPLPLATRMGIRRQLRHFFEPRKARGLYQHPDLGRPADARRCRPRARPRTRPGRWWRTYARPTSPIVLGLWTARSRLRRVHLGDSTRPRGTRVNFTTPRPPVHRVTRPGAPASARGPPGTRAFPFPVF